MTAPERDAAVVPHKLRVRPEDFEVSELVDLEPGTAGSYRLYRLTKRGWTTSDALAAVARRFGLPRGAIAYGGRKDRHAHTVQYVTIGDRRDLGVIEPGYRLEPVGFVDRPMGPTSIRANAFRITLRAMSAAGCGTVATNALAVGRDGVPNYFDDQRFGSFDRDRGFVGRMLVEGQWEEALKSFLALPRAEDPAATKARKAAFLAYWWRWEACLEHARTATERHVLAFLARRGADYLAAINLLPRDDVSMALSAYQSHLWNRLLERLVAGLAVDSACLPGRTGHYRFPRELDAGDRAYLDGLLVPTPSARAVMPDERTAALLAAVLADEGIAARDLRLRDLRHAYLKSTPRAATSRPASLVVGEPEPDELFPGRLRTTVSFALPRGAYATMVVRRLVLAVRPRRAGARPQTADAG